MAFNVRAVEIRQALIYDVVLVDNVIMLMIAQESNVTGLFSSTWNSVLVSIEPLYLATRYRNERFINPSNSCTQRAMRGAQPRCGQMTVGPEPCANRRNGGNSDLPDCPPGDGCSPEPMGGTGETPGSGAVSGRGGGQVSVISGKSIAGLWIEEGLLHIQGDSGYMAVPIGTLYYFMRKKMSRQLRDEEHIRAVRRYAKCLAQACRDVDTLSHISYMTVFVNTGSGTYAAVVEHGYNLFGKPSRVVNAYVIAKREEDEWIDLMTNEYAEHVELVEPDTVRFVGEGDYDADYMLYDIISLHKLAEPQLPQEARKIRQWLLAKLSR